MSNKFPHSVVQCLAAIAQHHGLPINPERLIEDYALAGRRTAAGDGAAHCVGHRPEGQGRQAHWAALQAQGGVFPLIARLADNTSVIVVSAHTNGTSQVAILNPLADRPTEVLKVEQAQFCKMWQGDVFLMKRQNNLPEPNRKFGFRWFIPEIMKQKAALRDIAIAAMAMHFLALASPIFFQLVIDKVLVHQSISTLWVLGVGIVIALVLDALFGFLRQILTPRPATRSTCGSRGAPSRICCRCPLTISRPPPPA
jgi:subfamily B ATP-binding cassette protein HlyB/CyaB